MDNASLQQGQLTKWAETCLRINHLNTLVQREISSGSPERATSLAERARQAAWTLFNEMIAAGTKKPDGFREPEDVE